eukprot:Nitzschia sp. Nitz4//scaffold51_size120721//80177//81490//NITZ4_003738-RA/size120721-processed-gene-0.67-mRNA-1//1//CDS//3329553895//1473//frame0
MFSNQQAEVALNVPVKTLEAVKGDPVHTRFVAGSASLATSTTVQNHVHLLRYHPDLNQLGHEASLLHPTGPISSIQTSPTDKSLLLTVAEQSSVATLWKIPLDVLEHADTANSDEDDAVPATQLDSLQQQTTLSSEDPSSPLIDMLWQSTSLPNTHGMEDGWDQGIPPATSEDSGSDTSSMVVTLNAAGVVQQWDVSFGAAESIRSISLPSAPSPVTTMLPPRMKCDPHSASLMAVTSHQHIQCIDWRQPTPTSFLAHRLGVIDLDYNPNKPHVLATSGQDGMIKFWDLRHSQQPLLVARGAHHHWVTKVRYNPFHDQLFLSAGTDPSVHLWRMSTISSAPLLTWNDDDDDDNENDNDDDEPESSNRNDDSTPPEEGTTLEAKSSGPNRSIARHEHLDSVYSMAWGATDAWVYATAGYDGKVSLHHVPSKEKYNILL